MSLNGKSIISIEACYNGEAAEGERIIQPFRALGEPLLDTFREIPYSHIGTVQDIPADLGVFCRSPRARVHRFGGICKKPQSRRGFDGLRSGSLKLW